MTKSIKNRLARIVLFAALALMFWFFKLDLLAMVFGALVVLPVVIGFFIWMWKSKKK